MKEKLSQHLPNIKYKYNNLKKGKYYNKGRRFLF
ncbi:hypothetical protein Megpolyxen_01814 (plasmid) [Candidatus Megaera polyxenophila]|nr:hypothetical protein Megpolyxen_01814 [Candidatus Megaera polyxenophila]